MSNIKVVKIDKILDSSKKTKKKQDTQMEYLKNIIRNKTPDNNNPKRLSNILSKNDEIEKLLSRKKSAKRMLVKEIIKKDNTNPKKVSNATKEVSKAISNANKEVSNATKEVSKATKEVSKANKEVTNKSKKFDFPIIQSKKNKKEGKIVNKNEKGKKRKKRLPKSIKNLKPETKNSLTKYFKKISRKKKLIAADIVAPKIKRKTKTNKKLITSAHTEENPFTKVIQKVIKKNSKKISKNIEKMPRNKLIDTLVKLDLISKDTKAPTNILQDIYKIYQINQTVIDIKK